MVQNIRMCFQRKKYWMTCVVVCLFCWLLLGYQEIRGNNTDLAFSRCLEDVFPAAEDPARGENRLDQALAKVSSFSSELFSGSVGGTVSYRYTDSFFEEYMLFSNIKSYINLVKGYPQQKANIIESLKGQERMALSPAAVMRSRITREKYEAMPDMALSAGNYIFWEKMFQTDISDFIILILAYLTIYHLIILEREKKIMPLLFSTRRGGSLLAVRKAGAGIVILLFWFLILLGGKLLILSRLYLVADPSAQMQNLRGFMQMPYAMSIGMAFAVQVLWKMLCLAVAVSAIALIGSLPVSQMVCGFLMLCAVGVEFLISMIPSHVSWVLFRDMSLMWMWDFSYFMTNYRSYILLQNGGNIWYLAGFELPLLSIVIHIAVIWTVLFRLYHVGVKNGRNTQRSILSFFSYPFGSRANEWLRFGLHSGFLLILVLLTAAFIHLSDFKEVRDEKTLYYKTFVKILNEKDEEGAREWIVEKKQSFVDLRTRLDQLQALASENGISQSLFDIEQQYIVQQLAVEPIILELEEQSERIRTLHETQNIVAKYEVKPLADQLFEDPGRSERILIALWIGIFISFACMTVFPQEIEQDTHRLVCSTPQALSSMHARIRFMELCVFLFSTVLLAIWLFSLHCKYSLSGLGYVMQSFHVFGTKLSLSMGMAVAVEVVWKSLLMVLILRICLLVSLFIREVTVAQIVGVMLTLFPLVIDLTGMTFIRKFFWNRFLVFGDGLLFGTQYSSVYALPIFATVWTFGEICLRKWLRLGGK
ncbi:MAG: hypothetical protein J5757_07660 [Lachnospiraceae bacterium]|nr:hypothetical protein [Lachnospiraceae bacterium]